MTDRRVVKFPGRRRAVRAQPNSDGDGSPAPDESCAAADNSNGRAKPYTGLSKHQFECLTAAIRAIAPKDRPAAQRAWRKSLPPSPRNGCLRAVQYELIECVFWKDGYAEVRLKSIAKAVGCSKRRARSAVRSLVDLGLIGVLHRYGQDGHQIASRYVPLAAKADKAGEDGRVPPGGHQSLPGEDGSVPPREDGSVPPSTLASSPGDISPGQPQQQPSARSGPCAQGRRKHRGSITLRAGEAAFDAWITEMRENDRDDMANAALAAGEIRALKRYPENAPDAWPNIEGWEPTPDPAGPDR